MSICYLSYNNAVPKPVVELDRFGYNTLSGVLRAEKLYITKIQDIKLLGLRIAAICNLITNAIFQETSFELLDAFDGGKLLKDPTFDIRLESENLKSATKII